MDVVHESLFSTLGVIHAFAESAPQVLLQGYIILVAKDTESIINLLTFVKSVIMLVKELASYLNSVDEEEFVHVQCFILYFSPKCTNPLFLL